MGTVASGLLAIFILALSLLLPRRERDNPIAEIERALKAGEFVPYYQPIVDIRSGRLRGAEVLIRWRKPDGSIVPPASFIPLAESSGLIIELTRALMRRVCQEAGAVLGRAAASQDRLQSDGASFRRRGDRRATCARFSRNRALRLSQVVLEVTERQPLENLTETRRVVAALQGLGVKIAIDDVGTGHSGLSYMLKLGVDIIKIDKMFIDSIGTDRNSNTIIETLIDLAQNMRMDVVAEGRGELRAGGAPARPRHSRGAGLRVRAAAADAASARLACNRRARSADVRHARAAAQALHRIDDAIAPAASIG